MNAKKIAQQLDIISEAFTALASTFRAGGSGEDDSDGDATPAESVPATPAAAKRTRKSRAAAAPTPAPAEDEDEVTVDDVREKLKALMEAKGKDRMVEALASVGAGKLSDVDESQYQELINTAQQYMDEEEEEEEEPPKKRTRKAKGPTLDEVTAAAKALIAADKPAYLKITKKLGKPSEMDAADYAEALAAYEAAMPEEEEEEDDDDL